MHSSIMIFAYFIYFKSLPSPLLAALRRTFLYSLLNGALFLTYEPPKWTFSCCDGCRIYHQKLADWEKISFCKIMLC